MKEKIKIITLKIEKFISEHEFFAVFVMMTVASVMLAHSFRNAYPLHTATDELGTIVGAASVAGCDWSGVISRSGYYGFGYYSLFAPLFKMHLSPIIIYRIILITTRILRGSVISGIAYYIGKQYYHFSSKIELIILSLICTFPIHPNDDANIINDVVLDIFLWIIILSLCKITQHIGRTGKCLKWIFIYIVAAFYSMFLHTRALVIVIASLIVLTGIFIYTKKRRLLVSLLIIPMAVFGRLIISAYQNAIWSATGNELKNASVNMTMRFPVLDIKTWEVWFVMLIGHISVQSVLTGFLFLLAVVSVVRYLYVVIVRKQKSEMIYVNIVLGVSVLSMGAVFAAFMISNWSAGMYSTWTTVDKGQTYAYKALCYVRYWNVFSMPFLYTGVYLSERKVCGNCMKQTLIAGIILTFGFVDVVIPIVRNNSSAASFLYTYLTERTEEVNAQFYYKCILVCMVFTAFALVIYIFKNNRQWALFPILILMLTGYNRANANFNLSVMERISSMVLSSYEQKCYLEEAGTDIGHIYAYDDRKADHNWLIFSVLQFYFYEYRIEDEYPSDLAENDIIITCQRSEKIESDFPQLNCYQLDDNEVWYTGISLIGYLPVEKLEK